jgi:hypothetical protein
MLKTNCRQAGLTYLLHDKRTRGNPHTALQRPRNRQRSSLRSRVFVNPFVSIHHVASFKKPLFPSTR